MMMMMNKCTTFSEQCGRHPDEDPD